MVSQIHSGDIALNECRLVGRDSAESMPVVVYSSRIETKNIPAADSRVFVGEADEVRYRQVADQVNVQRHRYSGVIAPGEAER